MIPSLPNDIYHLICEELGHRREFGTLYSCATVSKNIAVSALSYLYRAQHQASIKEETSNEGISLLEQERVARRWSTLWRSIILSCMNKTLFRYCHYIRVLDLRDLQSLLEDDRFKGSLASEFFSGELSRFGIEVEMVGKNRAGRKRAFQFLSIKAIVDAVGELVTQHTPLLEEIDTGYIVPSSLARWLPRMPQLRSINVWDGAAFGEENMAALVRQHCPHFRACAVYMCERPDESDAKLSRFLSGLQPNSLESFVTYSKTGFGPEGLLSLNGHGQSLTEIRVVLEPDALQNLNYLQGCTAVEILELTDDNKLFDLEAFFPEVFAETVNWLCKCEKLQTLILHNFTSGAAMATPVLLEEKIKLHRLEVDSYAEKDHRDFHRALSHQKSLKRLVLESDQIDTCDGLDTLAQAVCELTELRILKLIGISAFFRSQHIESIATSLPHLEELYIGGLGLEDDSLLATATLRNLRLLSFSSITNFSADGLIRFARALGPGNRGMLLAVDNANAELALSEDEQASIRTELAESVDGRFEYTLFRDPEVSEYEEDSD